MRKRAMRVPHPEIIDSISSEDGCETKVKNLGKSSKDPRRDHERDARSVPEPRRRYQMLR